MDSTENPTKLYKKIDLSNIISKKIKVLEREHEQEKFYGNTEYKLQVIKLNEYKCEKLKTQMKWRLDEGSGRAVYYVGISDSGKPIGISKKYMIESIKNLKCISEDLDTIFKIIYIKRGKGGGFCGKIMIKY